jgi:hypothetical protein
MDCINERGLRSESEEFCQCGECGEQNKPLARVRAYWHQAAGDTYICLSCLQLAVNMLGGDTQ